MRVVEHRIQRIRGQCGGIVLIHFYQGCCQVARVGVPGGVGVRLELVFARIGRGERMQQKAEYRQHHEEQQQGKCGGCVACPRPMRNGDAQPPVEPVGLLQFASSPSRPGSARTSRRCA